MEGRLDKVTGELARSPGLIFFGPVVTLRRDLSHSDLEVRADRLFCMTHMWHFISGERAYLEPMNEPPRGL